MYSVTRTPGVRHTPVCGAPGVTTVLLAKVTIIVIHLVYRRLLSTSASTLSTPVVLGGGRGGHGHNVGGGGGARPGVRAQGGAGPRDPQLLSGEVVQARAVLLAALLRV